MKLQQKTRRYYLTLVLALLAVWSLIFTLVVHWAITDSVNESLMNELDTVTNQLRDDASIVQNYARVTHSIDITPADTTTVTTPHFKDANIYSSIEDEMMPYREVRATIKVGAKYYRLVLRRPMVEYDDLFMAIAGAELLLLLLLAGGMWWLNRGLMRRLWQPFFITLQNAGEYRIGRGTLDLPETLDIDEFNRLNRVLNEMTDTIRRDYQALKQFTENASHEIQTPLSVIKNRIELLIQREDTTEEQMSLIQETYQAANKLSRLNQGLLLLTKIENRQFDDTQTVKLGALASEQIEQFLEMTGRQNMSCRIDIHSETEVQMNRDLAELLVRNLVSNAVKHGNEDGAIRIRADRDTFLIANTGEPPGEEEDPNRNFERFKKSRASDSLGLGLSIVKAICEVYDFKPTYTFEDGWHILRLQIR